MYCVSCMSVVSYITRVSGVSGVSIPVQHKPVLAEHNNDFLKESFPFNLFYQGTEATVEEDEIISEGIISAGVISDGITENDIVSNDIINGTPGLRTVNCSELVDSINFYSHATSHRDCYEQGKTSVIMAYFCMAVGFIVVVTVIGGVCAAWKKMQRRRNRHEEIGLTETN